MNDLQLAGAVAGVCALYGLYLIGHGINRDGINAAGVLVVGLLLMVCAATPGVLTLLHWAPVLSRSVLAGP